MSTVYIRQARYEPGMLRSVLFSLLERLDRGRVRKQSRVLIKPNLLAPAPPDRAMITHPLIVRTVVEYVLEHGGIPQVSDSPAMGTFDRVMREGGITAALEGLPVLCRPFTESVLVDVGPPFNRIEIAADAVNADLVINLPKLKTHTQMLLTLGVKNTFGCIVGMRKPEWHFRAGVDREKFADLLVRIHAAVNPGITILDGILAMEGQGPGKGGQPRELNVIMGADNAFALDAVVCRMLGLPDEKLMTNQIAAASGRMPELIETDGDMTFVQGLRLPEITPLVFGPKGLHRFMRKHLVQRPVCEDTLCRHCGECWRYCPAGAITPALQGLTFDYDKCIRCYCCIEVCPHGALSARETAAGKVVRSFLPR